MTDAKLEDSNRLALERLAYRMLGTWADAEDIAQESLLRWFQLSNADREGILEPLAWLRTVATRLSLDRLKSARRQRETYIGSWLPEPILVDDAGPESSLELAESINLALMVTLQKLSDTERAAFLLHDVFDYTFEEVAAILEKQPATCRKLASRARASIREDRSRFEFDPNKHQALLKAFLQATQSGDSASLEKTLASDIAVFSDGGGKARAALKVLRTREIATRFFLGLRNKSLRSSDREEYRFLNLNGLPGVIHLRNGVLETAISVAVSNNQIQAIYQQRNPQKLARLARELGLPVAIPLPLGRRSRWQAST